MSCGNNIVGGCFPGPQGPPGPTGPTGPGGGGTAGAAVSIGGNTAGTPSLISSGTLVLAGGNNVTLSQNGQSVTISGGQSTQTQPAGSIAGIGVSSATQAGSTLGVTLSTNGLSLAIPQWLTGGGGVDVSIGGNTSGTPAIISNGTLVLAGGNNVTLSQNGNSITISANTVAAATLSVSAGSTSGAFAGLTFSNGSNVSFGLNNGTITASVLGQSTQTQASGNIAGVGTTFNGANVSGSMTLNSAGLNLSLSSPVETGVGISAAGSSQAAGTILLSNANGVSFGMVGSTVTASVAAGGGGGLDVTLGGNTAGVLALVSTGTLFLAGGNNITLSQNGNSVTLSGANAGGAQTGISGIQVSNTTYSSGTVTLQNANGITFGSSGANGISASYNSTQFAGTGTTFAGTNISASITHNSLGLNLALSGPNESGIGISAAGSSQTAGNVILSNANGVTFGMVGSTITASVVGGSAATTGGIYAAGNTTAQSSSSTYGLSSLNLSLAGILSGGWSSNTFVISAPGTTGLTQLSAGMSTGGNTLGTTGLASAQLVLAGGANITLSGSTNGGSMTLSVVGAAGVAGSVNFSAGTTSGNLNSVVFSNSNGVSFGLNGGTITASAAGGGGGVGFGVSTAGNTAGATGTVTTGNVVLVGSGPISLSQATGAAGSAATITINGPATSLMSGTGIVSISVNGSTISIGANALTAYAVSNSTQATSGTVNGTALSFAGAGGVSIGVSNGSVVISGGAGGGGVSTAGLYGIGNTTQNSSTTLNLSALSFNGLGELTVGYSNGSIQISSPPSSVGVSTGGNTAGNTGTYSGQIVFAGGNNITLSVGSAAGGAQTITISGAAGGASTVGLYALGNTTQNSSTTLNQSALSFNALGAATIGYSNGSIQVSAPATSSISGTGQVSVAVNASTISIGVPNYGTLSYWDNGILNGAPLTTALGAGSVVLQAIVLDANLSISALREFISGSFSVTNSSYGNTISIYAAIYTRNGSTLSLATSGSQSYGLTNTSNNSASIYSGIKGLTLPLAASMTPGNYWLALMSNTASSGFNFATFNNVVASEGALTYNGILGSNTAGSNQVILGGGYFSTTSASLPASIGFSQITGSVANIAPFVNMYNVTA